jgi:prepilin-type N-terminal cleavage/methylation domain-containing protein
MRPPAGRQQAGAAKGRALVHAGTRRGPRRGGFTLLEILLVLMLLVILAVFSWPALERRIETSALPESANKFRAMLFMARSSAIMQHKRYRVRFEPGVRDPFIEVEPDPIGAPGNYIAAPDPWAYEPMLLGEVQVHRINYGRPIYLTPKSSEEEEVQSEEGLNEVQTSEEVQVTEMEAAEEGPPVDELRPEIVFDVDGRTEWATLILSTIAPEEELLEETAQLWLVLDGRTGLAKITEQVTEAMLADESFYIDRLKLTPPELDSDQFSISTLAEGGESGGLEGLDIGALAGGAGALDPGAMGDAGAVPQLPSGPPPEQSFDEKPDEGQMDEDGEGQSEQEALERMLADPNLTEDQKEKIRQAFEGRGGGGKP